MKPFAAAALDALSFVRHRGWKEIVWLIGLAALLMSGLSRAAEPTDYLLPPGAPSEIPLAAAESLEQAAPYELEYLPPCDEPWSYHVDARARAYYLNDQRIEFTGMEETFAVEGVLAGGVEQRVGAWQVGLDGELFFTQPYERNVLVDNPVRESFAPNFDNEVLAISQLHVSARREDWYLAAGRFVTPFGRFYFTNFRNSFDDSPFIRSEAILFRETGILAQWDPEGWVCTAALTNGGPNQDANSSKALVARVGIDRPWFAAGGSVKVQDGIGSEGQKFFNEHFGLDAMVRRGRWQISTEVILDHYGLRRPGLDPLDITWGRSLYFREQNKAWHQPIQGFGYYVNLGYEGERWSLAANYGEYYPEELGIREHDATIRRGIFKATRHWTSHLETYGVVMVENDLRNAFPGKDRRGIYLLAGVQWSL